MPDAERWEGLLDAVIGIGADLSLDGVLSRIVEVAGDLAGARYAALGVLSNGPGKRLRTFVTHGMSEQQVTEIGDYPEGHGLLGHIIDRPEPLRLHDLTAHPESYGVPAQHPPMHSFLGVPVRIRDRVFGNLYLTEKVGGDFTEQDERIVVALAAAAGVAIENAKLHDEAATRERWLAATADVETMLSAAETPAAGLEAVTARAAREARADAAWLVGSDGETWAVVPRDTDRNTWPGPTLVVPAGPAAELVLAWDESHAARQHDLSPAVPARYAEQVAVALELASARDDHERLALFEDRDRIGRDLHDLVIQRLFAIGLSLQSTGSMVDRPEARGRLDTAVDDLDATIKDIRRSIFALGSTDDAADIQAEVTRLCERATATLKFRPVLRFEGPVRALVSAEVAPELLAVLAEALSNAAKHAAAGSVTVIVSATDEVRLTVVDDGRGLPPDVTESGLSNMRLRAERLGGTFGVESRPGGGTTLTWAVPTGS